MLQNKEVHKNCFCYQSKERPMVELREFERATSGRIAIREQEIIFVLSGAIAIEIEYAERQCVVRANQFVFVPTGVDVKYRVSDDTTILTCRVEREVAECHIFRVNKMMTDSIACDEIHVADFNDRIAHFVKGLADTVSDGLMCSIYTQLEVSRVLFLIHAYYPYDECLRIFSPVVSHDVRFSEFVRLNYSRYRTVELMAKAMNMSLQQFSKRFRRVFGRSPGSWMQEEKARDIYRELCQSSKTLKEIGAEYGFLQPNFIRYCRMNYGMSPGAIRQHLKTVERNEDETEEDEAMDS